MLEMNLCFFNFSFLMNSKIAYFNIFNHSVKILVKHFFQTSNLPIFLTSKTAFEVHRKYLALGMSTKLMPYKKAEKNKLLI